VQAAVVAVKEAGMREAHAQAELKEKRAGLKGAEKEVARLTADLQAAETALARLAVRPP
jgi:hypothetical protein